MTGYGKRMVFILMLFFSLGLGLGLLENHNVKMEKDQNEEYASPQKEENQPSTELYNGINSSDDSLSSNLNRNRKSQDNDNTYDNNADKISIKVDKNSSPDQEYYKKAKILQEKYPDTFFMQGQGQAKKIALTFDDGPNDHTTSEILDILKRFDIAATFFVLGKNAKAYPEIVKRIFDEGHQVGNHSWSHLRPTELTDQEFMEEINPVQEIMHEYSNLSPSLYYRPPYGLLTPSQVEYLDKKGYKVISWSIDSLDWNLASPKEIQDKVVFSAHPGAIVLMHSAGGKDNRENTTKALPEIIHSLSQQGYEFVTIHELLNND
ncbi:MAG: polysaccharide deacetylase family protein [Clostridiales bacterium]|nr:polysaccharide deacetylase family protein [Clostridiales bacterium]